MTIISAGKYNFEVILETSFWLFQVCKIDFEKNNEKTKTLRQNRHTHSYVCVGLMQNICL